MGYKKYKEKLKNQDGPDTERRRRNFKKQPSTRNIDKN